MTKPIARRVLLLLLGLALFTPAGLVYARDGAGVILNTVEAAQIPGEAAFDVTAYVTVFGLEGQPLNGLPAERFTLSEDGAMVEITTLEQASAVGMDIVLLLDTSGSMGVQGKMAAVQEAASAFIQNLAAEDRVAVVTFDESVDILQVFSADHLAAGSIVSLVAVEPDSGTCLYDAAYQAVELASTSPQGRRAVVLITDGVDELPAAPGTPCSAHTLDDVTTLATQGTTRTPVYTVGIGGDVNDVELRRLAEQSGGVEVVTPGPEDLTTLLADIGQQLKSQYALTYRSTATGGAEHNLTVTAALEGVAVVDRLSFVLPTPVVLTLDGLSEGQTIEDTTRIEALVSGPVEVQQVTFAVNGETVTEASQAPYELTLNTTGLGPGSHSLAANVTLSNGQMLERTLRFTVAPPAPIDVPLTATSEPAPQTATLPPNALPFLIGAAALVLVVGGYFFARWQIRPIATIAGGASGYAGPEDFTHAITFDEVKATLITHASATLKLDQPIDMDTRGLRLGSAADNDMVISDEEIAPYHAEVRFEGEAFVVYDLDSGYGTVVNGQRVGPEGASLKNGNDLSLGANTLFVYRENPAQWPAANEPLPDDDIMHEE